MNIDSGTFFKAYGCLGNINTLLESGVLDFSKLDSEGLSLINKTSLEKDEVLLNMTEGCNELSERMYNTIQGLLEIDKNAAYYFDYFMDGGEFADFEDRYDGEILHAGEDEDSGTNVYIRADGVTVKETYCQINLENAPEFDLFRLLDGDKVINGVKVSDMEYWVREDGAQMLGDYVCVATTVIPRQAYGVDDDMGDYKHEWAGGNYNYGDIVETSLGPGIVMGRCGEAYNYLNNEGVQNYDIYTSWESPSYASKVRNENYVPTNYANDPLLENGGQSVIKAPQTYEQNGISDEWAYLFPDAY